MSTATAGRRAGNLPAELTSLVGRKAEVAGVRRLLEESRLVTLTGVAGVGKTRIAVRTAAELTRAFADGVFLVELSSLGDDTLVANAVAEAMELHEQSIRPAVDVVADFLIDRQILLVLDTCEHLVAGCAALAETLLKRAPRLRIVATSRHPLDAAGEHVLVVQPLEDPEEAMRLFAERAAAAVAEFALTETNRTSISALCARLEGIPLAIELAAVRLRALTPDQLAARLEDRFRILGRDTGTRVNRHQTLRTAIGWSHELCEPEERLLWARLAVFRGDFDLEAAEQVCADADLRQGWIVDHVTGLVEKSIVFRAGDRYRMLDSIREYGGWWLDRLGETRLLQVRHRDYYLDLARRGEAAWSGPNQVAWCARMTREAPNLRAALDFCAATPDEDGLDLAGSLGFFWFGGGHLWEGRRYLERFLDADQRPSTTRAKALWVCASLAGLQADRESAARHAQECLALAEGLGDDHAIAHGLQAAGFAKAIRGDLPAARETLSEAVRRHRLMTNNPLGLLPAMLLLAACETLRGALDPARDVLGECRDTSEARGDLWMRSYADLGLAINLWMAGEIEPAIERAKTALAVKRLFRDPVGIIVCCELLGWLACLQGRPDRAARLLGAADGVLHGYGVTQTDLLIFAGFHSAYEGELRGRIGDKVYARIFAEGCRLGLNEAIAFALEEDPAPAAPAVPVHPLTKRERQIAGLVADGLSNREIAERLVIAKRTADSHVEHILAKLGFSSRAQIAAWITRGT